MLYIHVYIYPRCVYISVQAARPDSSGTILVGAAMTWRVSDIDLGKLRDQTSKKNMMIHRPEITALCDSYPYMGDFHQWGYANSWMVYNGTS